MPIEPIAIDEEWITPKEAAVMANGKRTESCIRKWGSVYEGLTRKIGGRVEINSNVLREILTGNPPSLIKGEPANSN